MRLPALHRPPRKGFTLIELVVSMAIVVFLAALATPMIITAVKREKEAELRAALRQIRTAIDDYREAVDEGRVPRLPGQSRYPPSLATLALGVPDALDPQGRRIYFLRRIPRDPFAANPDVPAADTWGLRSYASPPDAPAPGADVFDVYSRSEATGSNGIPYRQW
jgi:general secretion pathway protein G